SSLLLAAVTSHGQSTNRLHFPTAGFSISTLETTPGQDTQQALMMLLPPSSGFAANVNVQVQPYADTMDDYLAFTLKQCKSAGLKMVQVQTTGKLLIVFEYSGEMEGRKLHWYARAEKSGEHVYLATATATEEQWSKLSDQLKACVDSM